MEESEDLLNTSMWGPPFWRVLHTIAYASDSAADTGASLFGISREHDAQLLFQLLSSLHLVLPCTACMDSYREFFPDIVRTMITGDTGHMSFADIVLHRCLSEFTYLIHKKVNDKLAFNAAEVAYAKATTSIPREEFLQLWMAAEETRQPSFSTIVKRMFIFNVQPFVIDDVWLILLALTQRSKSEAMEHELRLLVCTVALVSKTFSNKCMQEFADHLNQVCVAVKSAGRYESVYGFLLSEYIKTGVNITSVGKRLLRMKSSSCSPTSCQ
jgi:hypothetical protein